MKLAPGMKEVATQAQAPWVLVAGGFHRDGGMDKANAALAEYLLARKTPIHLVAHRIDSDLLEHPLVTAHLVPRPLGSFFLGEIRLRREGRAVARKLTLRNPSTRVLVNGGNCRWADINWVHYVHHAWSFSMPETPLRFKLKGRLNSYLAKRRERSAINAARFVVANSELTRRDLIKYFKADPAKTRTVYLGTDPAWTQATLQERTRARAWLKQAAERPLVAFVGAFGHDERKGFDCLWAAWEKLCARADWDADLVVAGGGVRASLWRERIEQSPFAHRAKMLGFTDRVFELLAAADLLVSPARYETYGLNVQEAICRGVPALVSSSAGVVERYTEELGEMILPDPEDVDELVARLLRWRADVEGWKKKFAPLSEALRRYTWADMAREIVSFVEGAEDDRALGQFEVEYLAG